MATTATYEPETDDDSTEKVKDDYQHAASTRRYTGPLLARRRENFDRDGHLGSEQYDYIDDNGRKIQKAKRPGPDGTTNERKVDVTSLLGAAPSTTANITLLEMEARLLEQGHTIENPHIPANDDVLRAALDHLRPDDLTPAWEAIDG